MFNTEEDLESSDDPFWLMLTKDDNDFYARENIIMSISTLKATSLIVNMTIFTGFIREDYETKEENEHSTAGFLLSILIGFRALDSVFWWFLLWTGTTHKQFFRKWKMIVLIIILGIQCVSMMY
jgi:hypothetical protein